MYLKRINPGKILFTLSISIICLIPFQGRAYATHGCAPENPSPVNGQAVIISASTHGLVLNEVLTMPHSIWNCNDTSGYTTASDSWIELYNDDDQAYNLYNSHIYLDNGAGSNPYYLPIGTSIASHSYVVLFPCASGNACITEKPTIRLMINSISLDQTTVPIMTPDQSWDRLSNGTGDWQTSNAPTIGFANSGNTAIQTPVVKTHAITTRATQSGVTVNHSANTTSPTPFAINWQSLHIPASTIQTSRTPIHTVNEIPLNSQSMSETLDQKLILTGMVIALEICFATLCFLMYEQKAYKANKIALTAIASPLQINKWLL